MFTPMQINEVKHMLIGRNTDMVLESQQDGNGMDFDVKVDGDHLVVTLFRNTPCGKRELVDSMDVQPLVG